MTNGIVGMDTGSAKDAWATLIEDIERTLQRAKGIQPTPEILLMMLRGDVLPIMKDTMANMIALRDFVTQELGTVAEHLDDIEDRMVGIDGLGDDTQLLPEDADMIAKLAMGSKVIFGEMIKSATGDGLAKLKELIDIAEKLEVIAADKRIELEDEEDEDDEPDNASEPGEQTAGGPQQ